MNEKHLVVTKAFDYIIVVIMLLGFGFAVVSAGFFLENSVAAAGGSGEYDTLYFGNASHLPITLGVLFFFTVLILAYSDKKMFPQQLHAKFLRYMALSIGVTFLIYSAITTYLFLRFFAKFFPEPEAGYPFISLPTMAILSSAVGGYFLLRLHYTRKIFYAFMFAFFSIVMSLTIFFYLELYLLPYYSSLRFSLSDAFDYRKYIWMELIIFSVLFLFLVVKAKKNPYLSQMTLLSLGMWACASSFAFSSMAIYPLTPCCSYVGFDDDQFIPFVSLLTAFIILWVLIIALQKIKRDRIQRTHGSCQQIG